MAGVDATIGWSVAQSGGFIYIATLHCEHFDIGIVRNPSIMALPNQNGAGRGNVGHSGTGVPKNIVIDFGLMEETVSIQGKILDDEPVGMTVEQLMLRFRIQWADSKPVISVGDSPQGNGVSKLRITGTQPSFDQTWGVIPIKCDFSRDGGNLWWDYSMTFGVAFYPDVDDGFGQMLGSGTTFSS